MGRQQQQWCNEEGCGDTDNVCAKQLCTSSSTLAVVIMSNHSSSPRVVFLRDDAVCEAKTGRPKTGTVMFGQHPSKTTLTHLVDGKVLEDEAQLLQVRLKQQVHSSGVEALLPEHVWRCCSLGDGQWVKDSEQGAGLGGWMACPRSPSVGDEPASCPSASEQCPRQRCLLSWLSCTWPRRCG